MAPPPYCVKAPRLRRPLSAAATAVNGDAHAAAPVSDPDFRPRTMRISESVAYFARFVVQTLAEKRAQRRRGREQGRRLRNRLKLVFFGHGRATQAAAAKQEARAGGTLAQLNASRKSLVRLVVHDASLMVPAFGFLLLGAFMSSVIPHFYSSCISCVATGASREQLASAVGGLVVSQFLEAVFTGLRGALF